MFWSDRGSEKGGSGFFGSALGVAPISNLGGLGRFFLEEVMPVLILKR